MKETHKVLVGGAPIGPIGAHEMSVAVIVAQIIDQLADVVCPCGCGSTPDPARVSRVLLGAIAAGGEPLAVSAALEAAGGPASHAEIDGRIAAAREARAEMRRKFAARATGGTP